MNKDNAHLYLPLVQALVDGKLQIRGRDGWQDVTDGQEVAFFLDVSTYRIKPEPREWWQVRSRSGGLIGDFTNESDARDYSAETGLAPTHVREVLPT